MSDSNGTVVDPFAAEVAANAPVMLALVDARASCLWSNDAWFDFAGSPAPEDGAQQWLDRAEPEVRKHLLELLQGEDSFESEVRLRRADDRVRWLFLRARPLSDSGGTFGGYLLAAMDVTEWREAEHVLRFLTALSDALASSIERDEALARVARIVVPELADLCTITVVDDDSRIRRVAIVHEDNDVQRELAERDDAHPLDADDPSAIALVIRTGTMLYRPIVDAAGPDEPWPPYEPAPESETRSLVCVPLKTRDRIVGAIALVSWSRRFTPSDVNLVHEVARRCATAVDNASLLRRSEEARAHLALLSSIGEQLAASLDLDDTMRSVVRRVVPVFADAAVVALRQPDGTFRRSAICHVDAERERAFRSRFLDEVIQPDDPAPIARAARTGRPVIIEDFHSELTGAQSHPRRRAAYAAADFLGATSVLVVPLVVGDEPVGVLALGFIDSGRRYSANDLSLALDIARRASLAIDRAQVFDQERHVAETLQKSMLPEALPEVPGVEFHARYLAGGRIDVGGDWYDVIALRDGLLGLAIGDVAGHGVRAASVMGQLRNSLRAFATDNNNPATVVQRLNRFVLEQGPVDMATLCYAVFDPRTGRMSMTLAGHPPPLVMPARGEPSYAPARAAPPIGADLHSHFTSTEIDIATGTTVLLYTDGLIERRGESLDAGLSRLAHHARHASDGLERWCERILDELVGQQRPLDDVAMLGLRYVGAQRGPMRIRRPARAAELAPVRRVISAWLEAAGVAPPEIGSVAVAISEAATNAIEHAYGPGEGWFEVEAEIDAGVLRVAVRDEGRWRPKARGGGGRGLGLIGQLMDEFEVRRSRQGTEITMVRMLDLHAGKGT